MKGLEAKDCRRPLDYRKRRRKQSALWRLQKKLLNSLNKEAIRLRCPKAMVAYLTKPKSKPEIASRL